jgi:CBS domain-containing protein
LIASDLMTTRVVTVAADASVRAAARAMLENGVGGAPVIDATGTAIGMVSDGDLLGRRPEDSHRAWWLEILAEAAEPAKEVEAAHQRPVREVMSWPLIFVAPDAPVEEIAAILKQRRIKRLPVIYNGQLVGIVSRADLLAAVEELRRASERRSRPAKGVLGFLASLAGGADLSGVGRGGKSAAAPPPSAPIADRADAARAFSAAAFRDEARTFVRDAVQQTAAAKQAMREERRRQAQALLHDHVGDAAWRELIGGAEASAKRGDKEFLLYRFSSDLCSDGGRMIDVAEPGWEKTLRGAPAEIIERWRRELKPRGFGLSARIVSYEDGVLGDIGLVLTWGRDL